MKRLIICISMVLVGLSSCVKPGKEKTVPSFIDFVMLDKSGKNIVHSVNDNVVVSFTWNGTAISKRLMVYKCQTSATDTTTVSKYDGYVVTDLDTSKVGQGYMTDPSSVGVRTFNFTINGQDAGTAYFDYWGTLSTSLPQPPPSASFVFDGAFVSNDFMQGVLNNGGTSKTYSMIMGDNNSLYVYLLQQQ